MSSPSSPPLILDVRARRVERWLARGAVGVAVLIPWLFTAPLQLLADASVLLAILTYTGLRRAGWLQGPRRVAQIAWLADGRWTVRTDADSSTECELHPSTRVVAYGIWLRLREREAHRHHCLLLTRTDGLPDDVRRLIVRLRLDGAKALTPANPLTVAR